MRALSICVILLLSISSFSQQNEKISTIDFVEILNNNYKEATYYFHNNWKVLREMAIEKDYIKSFQVFEAPANEGENFEILLITTYTNLEQYNKREEHFQELIKEKGELKLLNSKKPNEFRKTQFSKEKVKQWN